MGVAYDISDYLNYAGQNVLEIRVDATQYEGWFYEGAGIYRHVWLNQYNPVHLDENPVFVYTDVKKDGATVYIETAVQNESYTSANIAVSAIITDRDGHKIGWKYNTQLTIKKPADKSAGF